MKKYLFLSLLLLVTACESEKNDNEYRNALYEKQCRDWEQQMQGQWYCWKGWPYGTVSVYRGDSAWIYDHIMGNDIRLRDHYEFEITYKIEKNEPVYYIRKDNYYGLFAGFHGDTLGACSVRNYTEWNIIK